MSVGVSLRVAVVDERGELDMVWRGVGRRDDPMVPQCILVSKRRDIS
jgi:hypothetical protein